MVTLKRAKPYVAYWKLICAFTTKHISYSAFTIHDVGTFFEHATTK